MSFHTSLSLVAFSVSLTLPILSHFVSPSNIFSRCFPCCIFPWPFQLSQDILVSHHRHNNQTWVVSWLHSWLPWCEIFYKMLDLLAELTNRSELSQVQDFLHATYEHEVPASKVPVTIVVNEEVSEGESILLDWLRLFLRPSDAHVKTKCRGDNGKWLTKGDYDI